MIYLNLLFCKLKQYDMSSYLNVLRFKSLVSYFTSYVYTSMTHIQMIINCIALYSLKT